MHELIEEIKHLIIESLELEDINIDDIKTDEPLFGDGLGLDSIATLAKFIDEQRQFVS